MADSWPQEIRKFFDQQKVFLVNPSRFIAELHPSPAAKWVQALSYLTAATAFSVILARVNVNLFGERIRRIATVSGVVSSQAEALIAVIILALVIAIVFRIFSTRWMLLGTITTMMYAIAFIFPVLAVLFVVVTRIGSVLLGETILFTPPSHVLGLGGPETSSLGIAIAVCFTTISFCWNAYFFWLLWSSLKQLYGLNGARSAVALLISIGGLYAVSDRISLVVEPVIRVLMPVFEHIFS